MSCHKKTQNFASKRHVILRHSQLRTKAPPANPMMVNEQDSSEENSSTDMILVVAGGGDPNVDDSNEAMDFMGNIHEPCERAPVAGVHARVPLVSALQQKSCV